MGEVFSEDVMWKDLTTGVEKMLEITGIRDDIILRSPERVVIDFSTLAQYLNCAYSQYLFDRLDEQLIFENFLKLIENIILEFHPNPDKFKQVVIKNMKMRLGLTKISDFTSSHFGKMVCIRAVLRNITDKQTRLSSVTFLCEGCGQTFTIFLNTDYFLVRDKRSVFCRYCLSKKVKEIDKKMDIIIRLKFEEPTETSEYATKIASCYGQARNLTADYIFKSNINVGDRVIVTGHLVENPTIKGTIVAPFFIEVDWVERDIQKELDETITPAMEEEFIRETADNIRFLDKLKRSIAPNIYLYDDCKLALAIQELSGINLRTKVWENPQIKKQFVNIILAGEPSSGKTQLAKFMMRCSPKIYFASGDQATITGLVGAVTQDPTMGGDWTLSAGALSLANGGTIIIDELNKLDAKEISKLNQVLTDYAIPIDKAKINTTIYTEVKLLGIMNPSSDVWRRDNINRQKILQLNLKKAFTTRMTLIFAFFEDDLSDEKDVEKAIRRQQGLLDENERDIYSVEWLKNYFVYAKRKDVVFDQEELVKRKMNFYTNIFKKRVKEYIMDVSEGGEYSKDEIPSKMRLLADNYEALLSGFARTQVTKDSVCRPLPHHYDLVDYYLERYYLSMYFKREQTYWEKVGINISTNKMTRKIIINYLLSYIGKNGEVPYEDIWEKWQELSGERDEEDFNKNVIDKLKRNGDIFEPRAGIYKLLGSPDLDNKLGSRGNEGDNAFYVENNDEEGDIVERDKKDEIW